MSGNIEEQTMRLNEISTRAAPVENGIADNAAAAAELARKAAVMEARPKTSAPPSGFASRTASSLGSASGRTMRDDYSHDPGVVRVSAKMPVGRGASRWRCRRRCAGQGFRRRTCESWGQNALLKPTNAADGEAWGQMLLDARLSR